jgi:hypothetical protein
VECLAESPLLQVNNKKIRNFGIGAIFLNVSSPFLFFNLLIALSSWSFGPDNLVMFLFQLGILSFLVVPLSPPLLFNIVWL